MITLFKIFILSVAFTILSYLCIRKELPKKRATHAYAIAMLLFAFFAMLNITSVIWHTIRMMVHMLLR